MIVFLRVSQSSYRNHGAVGPDEQAVTIHTHREHRWTLPSKYLPHLRPISVGRLDWDATMVLTANTQTHTHVTYEQSHKVRHARTPKTGTTNVTSACKGAFMQGGGSWKCGDCLVHTYRRTRAHKHAHISLRHTRKHRHSNTITKCVLVCVSSQGGFWAGKSGAAIAGADPTEPDHHVPEVKGGAGDQRGGEDQADAHKQQHGKIYSLPHPLWAGSSLSYSRPCLVSRSFILH